MRIPDPKANTTTEAYLAYKAGYLEENELKPVLYEPYLHFDGWLAYWAGLTNTYPNKGPGKNLFDNSTLYHGYYTGDPDTVTADEKYRTVVIDNLPKGTYTFSCDLSDCYIVRWYGNGTSHDIKLALDQLTFAIETEGKFLLTFRNTGSTTITEDVKCQIEVGSTATEYEEFHLIPEMLCDEEALVAYLSGVTDTYPEEIKDPYDVRIVGYLKYLVSARWGRPEYPVNNEEFYLSTMKPPVVTNDTPSADIELDDTAEAPFIDVKAYGDTSQTTYTGKNKINSSISNMTIKDASVTESGGVYNFVATSTSLPRVTIPIDSLVEGATYTFSCKVRANKVNPSFTYVRLRATTTGGSWIASEPTQQYFSVSSDFVDVKLVFTAPSSSPAVWFYLSSSDVGEFEVDLDVKDIQVEAGEEVTAFEPYVGGVSAPSPDYPQDINVVTGRQTVKVRSKNLWGGYKAYSRDTNGVFFSTTPDGYIYGRGTATANAYSITGQLAYSEGVYISLTAGTYYLSMEEELPTGVAIQVVRTSDSNTIRDGVGSFTLAEDTDVAVRVRVDNGVDVSGGFTAHPMLEESATKTKYAPYGADYEINLDGKNLFNFNNGTTVLNAGSIGKVTVDLTSNSIKLTTDADSGSSIYSNTDFELDTTKTYIVSGKAKKLVSGTGGTPGLRITLLGSNDRVTWTTATNVYDNTTPEIDTEYSFNYTFSANYKYYRFRFYNNTASHSSIGESGIYYDLQLEEGSTTTEYEPYHAPIELCKIGDYQDYIYQDEDDDWYIHKATNKFVVNGSESEWSSSAVSGGRQFYIPLSGVSLVNPRQIYCDRFYFITGSTDENTTYVNSTGLWVIYKPTSNGVAVATTTNEFKTWLGSNITTVYYALATATDTLITDNNLIAQLNALKEGGSYEGKTYIKVTATDPNLPALLKVEAGEYD